MTLGKVSILRSYLCLMLLSCLCGPLLVGAQSVFAAERFGDWELVCPKETQEQERSPAAGREKKHCRLQQAQAVNEGKDIVFLFNIAMQSGRPIAIISTPLNVYLPFGLELSVDGGSVQRAIFETCNVTGCHAGFELKKAFQDKLKSGKTLNVAMQDTKSSKISLAVSLKGLAPGFAALVEVAK